MVSILHKLRQQWFLVGIGVVILLAKVAPSIGMTGGPLKPELTVKYVAVSLIFLNSGLSLPTEELTRAVAQLQLHAFIQVFTLFLVPVMMSVVVAALESSPMDQWLLKGLLVVGSMPPPVSSAVILTKSAGGNEAGAVFNSAFGSFLGIFFTPMWLLHFLGSTAAAPMSAIVRQLSFTVVLPLVIGQAIRSLQRVAIQRANLPFGTISSCTLLLIIYTTFCDTFSHIEVDIDELSLFTIIILVILLQICLLLLTFYLSTRAIFGFQPADVVACLFCSTHKSLTLGIPILRVMFSAHPAVSVISLPLLVYHPTQILLGGILVPSVRGWMVAASNWKRYPRLLSHV